MNRSGQRSPIVTVLVLLAAVWLVFTILGLLIKGLFYLFVIGLVLIAITIAMGAFKAGRSRRY